MGNMKVPPPPPCLAPIPAPTHTPAPTRHQAASDAYYLKHPEIEVSQRATFEEITDNISLAATSKKVGENEEMSRG